MMRTKGAELFRLSPLDCNLDVYRHKRSTILPASDVMPTTQFAVL